MANILIADGRSNVSVIQEAKRLLEGRKHSVATTLNGQEVLRAFDQGTSYPDILVLDFALADVDGFSVLGELDDRSVSTSTAIIWVCILDESGVPFLSWDNTLISNYLLYPYREWDLVLAVEQLIYKRVMPRPKGG
jgi:DNA-binding response OmpR family regulator